MIREYIQQIPRYIQRLLNISIFVHALSQEFLFEPLNKVQVQEIFITQRFLTNNCLHSLSIPTHRLVSLQLVRYLRMVQPSHAFADTRLHQSTERRQHIDRRLDLSVVDLSVYEYLSLGDVTSQIRNRVRDVVIRHGEDGELGDGAIFAVHTACSFVNGG